MRTSAASTHNGDVNDFANLPNAPDIDEAVDGQGRLRPHWGNILATFSSLRDGTLAEQATRLNAAFENEGITGILQSKDRPVWRLDPLPLPLTATEFSVLTNGLAQRAELIEAILRDVYGPQTLLAEGHLPPVAVFANDGFLRACHTDRAPHPGRRFMDFYAADLVRGPDGAWRVLADRTVGAAGIAYALENRQVVSRVIPEVYRGTQMRPLRPFFDVWQGVLQQMGHANATIGRFQQAQVQAQQQSLFAGLIVPPQIGPGIALLTPGTRSRHWFEHMMLARELSCALVESGDLTVRGGGVYLKTLQGLQRVDVLLNRKDPWLIDPLELDGGSVGVPGLMDAMRASAIHVGNHPGAGMAEAPALAAWLPALAQRLLGEPLKVASVDTVWMGDATARERVLADRKAWRIVSATDRRARTPEPHGPVERAAWRYCAVRTTRPSVVPCVGADGLEPRPVVLRIFMVCDGTTWHAMDGGLARIVETDGAAGGDRISKDVWVLNEEGREAFGRPVAPTMRIAIRRTTGDLPSRVADNFFWLGRYVERLENAARLVRATIARLSRGALLPHDLVELTTLSRILVKADLIPPDAVAVIGGGAALQMALVGSLRERGPHQGSIAALIGSVAQLTELVRDRLTGDMYGAFISALRQIRHNAQAVGANSQAISQAMVDILRFSASFAGLAAENMVRGGGWLFLELGRRVERAQAVCTQIGDALHQPSAQMDPALRLVLELCDSLITYRTRYLTVMQAAPVLDLVLADGGNPRGLAFQLASIASLLDQIAGTGDRGLADIVTGLTEDVQAMVARVAEAPDQAAAASQLPDTLHRHADTIATLSDRVTRHYFALLPATQTLGSGEAIAPLQGAA